MTKCTNSTQNDSVLLADSLLILNKVHFQMSSTRLTTNNTCGCATFRISDDSYRKKKKKKKKREMDKYHVLELIGEGSFGRVYKGRRKSSKQVSSLVISSA